MLKGVGVYYGPYLLKMMAVFLSDPWPKDRDIEDHDVIGLNMSTIPQSRSENHSVCHPSLASHTTQERGCKPVNFVHVPVVANVNQSDFITTLCSATCGYNWPEAVTPRL